jgi:peptidoglycan/LPS O-acetylase OafA/YrhL
MTTDRNVPLGYLRTFVTLLVVLHHALLAYLVFAPAPAVSLSAPPLIWGAFPVVDTHRTPGIDLIVGLNDTFFMSLMFLVSGLFAWPSLARKGAALFARDRALRLGLPFVASAAVLAPLAYYPAYLQSRTHDGFWHEWLHIGSWPAGPAWFLWVLLAFGLIAAALYKLTPHWGDALGRIAGRLSNRPIASFGALLAVSALAYIPMAAIFDPTYWMSFGPFFVQVSRLLHYAVYFFAGAALGAYGSGRGLLAGDGKLARRWPLWVAASLGAFILGMATFLAILATLPKGGPGPALNIFGNFTWALGCACSSFAAIAVFVRFARKSNRVTDNLGANAYGIYLYHYVCVSWLQYTLLPANLPGIVKALIVFVSATLVSWIVSAALRSLPRAFGRVPQPAMQRG